MRRGSALAVLGVLALGLPGCTGASGHDAWLVPRDSFLVRTRTVALSPLRLPENLEQPESAEALFDSLITAALRGAGFSVVSSDIVSDIWNQGADSIGGYYDPVTGLPDTSKLNPLRRHFKERLRREHGADAVLFPEIVVVTAQYADGTAEWDGTTQSVAGFFRVLLSAIGNTELPYGTAEALSLDVQIESVDGGAVFNGRGGIELWETPSGDGSRLNPVPRERLFADRKRNEKAVRMALGSVVGPEESGR